MSALAFVLYLFFVASWFLHLTARLPVLGTLRVDFWVAVLIGVLLVPGLGTPAGRSDAGKSRLPWLLALLFLYAAATVPFVQWPGSAVRVGLPQFVKAIVFYVFTVRLLTTRRRLVWLLTTFVACQTFRVIEPVYLHVTTGYWGSAAFMGFYEHLDRLSGSPYDIVNPNGLAFVILTVLPFVHYLAPLTGAGKVAYVGTMPLLIYALVLTGSRSGAVAFVLVVGLMWITARRKFVMSAVVLAATLVAAPSLSANLADRYLSIVSANTRNAATASGRIAGELQSFKVAARRPIFGHGVGTSREANANFTGADMPAHILYGEVAEELGFAGLAIFLAFLAAIVTNVARTGRALRLQTQADPLHLRLWLSLRVWLWMNLIFSFASYGLSEYEWYFAAGLSEVLRRGVDAGGRT